MCMKNATSPKTFMEGLTLLPSEYCIAEKNGQETIVVLKLGCEKIADFLKINNIRILREGVMPFADKNLIYMVLSGEYNDDVIEKTASVTESSLTNKIAKDFPVEMCYKRAYSAIVLDALRKACRKEGVSTGLVYSEYEFTSEPIPGPVVTASEETTVYSTVPTVEISDPETKQEKRGRPKKTEAEKVIEKASENSIPVETVISSSTGVSEATSVGISGSSVSSETIVPETIVDIEAEKVQTIGEDTPTDDEIENFIFNPDKPEKPNYNKTQAEIWKAHPNYICFWARATTANVPDSVKKQAMAIAFCKKHNIDYSKQY